MRFKGSEQAKKQAQAASENLSKGLKGFQSILSGLQGQLTPEELADYAKYKTSPEGRKQSAIFDNIKAGVSEVMDNIPKQ